MVLRRARAVALATGNRIVVANIAPALVILEAANGEVVAALDHCQEAVQSFRDSGDYHSMRSLLGLGGALLDRYGHHEAAATILGFALSPLTQNAFPEIVDAIAHVRRVLGDERYEALAGPAATAEPATITRFALEQIEQLWNELAPA